ncbi:MAG: hypothetical protein V4663_05975 [Bacteroidota bacterium]
MEAYNVGISSAEVGVFNPADGTVTGWTQIAVYKNTLKHVEEPGAETNHFEAGKSSPVKTHFENGMEKITFQIPKTDPDSLKQALDGDVTTVSGVKSWHKKKGTKKPIIRAFRYTSLDGTLVTVTKGQWNGSRNTDGSETAIWLMDITVTVLDTGFPLISDVIVKEPEEEEEV